MSPATVTKVGDNAAKVLFGPWCWCMILAIELASFAGWCSFQWELVEPLFLILFGVYNHGHWVVVNVVVKDVLVM